MCIKVTKCNKKHRMTEWVNIIHIYKTKQGLKYYYSIKVVIKSCNQLVRRNQLNNTHFCVLLVYVYVKKDSREESKADTKIQPKYKNLHDRKWKVIVFFSCYIDAPLIAIVIITIT